MIPTGKAKNICVSVLRFMRDEMKLFRQKQERVGLFYGRAQGTMKIVYYATALQYEGDEMMKMRVSGGGGGGIVGRCWM